jgi:hypothetical protein
MTCSAWKNCYHGGHRYPPEQACRAAVGKVLEGERDRRRSLAVAAGTVRHPDHHDR